ncbi:hypothetical protein FACS1894211_12710 [Clostridia bacterium]|nr:hypothetical protein FACS1894211_12710 [Clostridia bacterium]
MDYGKLIVGFLNAPALKGDTGKTGATGPAVPLVQSTGNSTTSAMSQKATTDAVNGAVKLQSPETQVINSDIAMNGKILGVKQNGAHEAMVFVGKYGTYEQEELGSESDPTCLNHNAKALDGTVVGKNILVNYKDEIGNAHADAVAYLTDVEAAVEAENTSRSEAISDITEKIPPQASTDNQLADKDFVNSSISNMAAQYVTQTAAGDTVWVSLDDLNGGTKYVSADVKLPEQVIRFVKEIAKIETWRGNLNKTARATIGKIGEVYKVIFGEDSARINPYADAAVELSKGDGRLTVSEIREIDNILQNFMHEVKNYDKVFVEGRAQSETDIAAKGIKEAKLTQKIKGVESGVKGAITGGIRRFFEQVYNPYRLMQSVSGYIPGSVMETLYKDFFGGNRRRAEFVEKSNKLLGKFADDKDFTKSEAEKITLKGSGIEATMSRAEMISLYLTSKREQGIAHILGENEKGKVRFLDEGMRKRGNLREAQIKGRDVEVDKTMLSSIESKLTAKEKEFIEATQEFFDKVSKEAKVDTDKQLYGVTNVEGKGYYPITVSSDELYTEVGLNTRDTEQTIRKFGFNRDTVPNAKNKLVIDSVFDVLARHIGQMSVYYGYALPIITYNRVMNKRIGGLNIQNETSKINSRFQSYMDDLLLDIQGVARGRSDGWARAISWLRWGTANAALALNPKVLLTQTASLASAMSEFNPKYVAKGIAGLASKQAMADVLKYSPLMAERNDIIGNIDVQELRKQGTKLGKAGEIITAPTKLIEKMDSRVIAAVYRAALNEQSDIHGYKIDSEENKIAAARRTEEVVFHSQQTSDPFGRSSLMRSKNELVRMFTMFHGDAFQLTSQFISSIDRLNTFKKMLKSGDAELIAIATKGMPEAKKAFAKSGAAVLTNVMWLTLIALAMKWIKGFKDDESVGGFITDELFGNLAGMLPLGSEFYSVLNGFDLDNPAYSAINTIGNAVKDSYSGIASLISDDKVDDVQTRSMLRKTALGFAQLLGVPLRNVESYTMGLVGKASPTTKEEYDALFKTKSNKAYMDAITGAIERGDNAAADTYLNIMFNSRTGKIKDDKVLETMRDLIEAGYTNVLPKSLGDEIIHNDEKIELTRKQYENFQKIYSEAGDKVKAMVNSSMFSALDDAAKAKAIKTVYDFYYNLGLEDLLGESLENKNILFSNAIPIEQLAMAIAQASQLEADLDKSGKSISGTRKTKVQKFIQRLNLSAAQKYMIMGYLGYVNVNGASVVKAYINRLNLSKTQKETLYNMSGYTLEKRGRVA